MAARALPKFVMPAHFPELLKDFAREVLRTQPASVEEFAVAYFTQKIAEREAERAEGLAAAGIVGTDASASASATATQQQQQQSEKSGVFGVTGTRHPTTEDTSTVMETTDGSGARFFLVCDGHGGSNSSAFVAKELWASIAASQSYKEGDVKRALTEAFEATDAKLEERLRSEEGSLPPGTPGSGACAVCAVVLNGVVYVANVGDSRCVLVRKGEPSAALSRDHKVSDESERIRVEAAGGFVHGDRLLGVLAVSRSFGDFEIKNAARDSEDRPALTCIPEVNAHTVEQEIDSCIILASDGLWDALSNNDAGEMALRVLADTKSPTEAAKALVKAAAEAGSEDDITAIVALL